jgi:hypothetical protein
MTIFPNVRDRTCMVLALLLQCAGLFVLSFANGESRLGTSLGVKFHDCSCVSHSEKSIDLMMQKASDNNVHSKTADNNEICSSLLRTLCCESRKTLVGCDSGRHPNGMQPVLTAVGSVRARPTFSPGIMPGFYKRRPAQGKVLCMSECLLLGSVRSQAFELTGRHAAGDPAARRRTEPPT